jgi:hypothetical protein
MTVSDLIQELSSYPQEMQVLISNTAFTDNSIPVFEVSALSILELEENNQQILLIEFDDDNFIDPSQIIAN